MTLLTCVFRCDRIPYFIVAVFEDSSIEKSDVFYILFLQVSNGLMTNPLISYPESDKIGRYEIVAHRFFRINSNPRALFSVRK